MLPISTAAAAVATCWRCARQGVPIRPWPHWRKVRLGYFGLLGLALCGGPVILADAFVMIPLLMVVLVAIGPLNHLSRQRPVCSHCSAVLGAPHDAPA